jgi:phenylacetate-coenzyme A ligase PaaK-like adenylate-forming protein
MGAIRMQEVGFGAGRYFHAEQETMPRERLAAQQLARLNATIANAHAHVPLHRARLDAAGVGAHGIDALNDLARLPFTVKSDCGITIPSGCSRATRPDWRGCTHRRARPASRPSSAIRNATSINGPS